jgi:hypothetical protein
VRRCFIHSSLQVVGEAPKMGIVMEDSVGRRAEPGMMVSVNMSEGGTKVVQGCNRILGVMEYY